MSCIISSNCQFINYDDKNYSYYTISKDDKIDGNVYDNQTSITSLNVSKKYRLKAAYLINKNNNYILDVVKPSSYESIKNSVNFIDLTPTLKPSLVTFLDVLADYNSRNNNEIKDHKEYYIYVLDSKSNYYVFNNTMMSKNISELVPNDITFCGVIEYLYDCKGYKSNNTGVNNISEDQGCFLNMDITKYIQELPIKMNDLSDIKLYEYPDDTELNKNNTEIATFSELFNNIGLQTYNQNKLTVNSIVIYFEDTPDCSLNSDDISIDRFKDYVYNPNNSFDDKRIRMCAVNTINNIFVRIQGYVDKMLLYKKINTTPDGYFLNDKKSIEKRMSQLNLDTFENDINKYTTLYKNIYTAILFTAILLFIVKGNKLLIKNYILLFIIIFMPYIFELLMTMSRLVFKHNIQFSKLLYIIKFNLEKYLSFLI